MVELKEPWEVTKAGLGELLGKQNQAKLRVKENNEKSVGAVELCMGHGKTDLTPFLLAFPAASTMRRCPSLHVGPPRPHV